MQEGLLAIPHGNDRLNPAVAQFTVVTVPNSVALFGPDRPSALEWGVTQRVPASPCADV